ncbi:MAG: V-type ATP synthase subunit D [Elusimicrobia bacterium]|nr:V-type ATP synthase subunit D [Elusimicrobiota bacterium]
MSKIKLTKGELKRQRDALRQFQHYLPTLQLKKQQLQLKIREARQQYAFKEKERAAAEQAVQHWIGVLGEGGVDVSTWIIPRKVTVSHTNIAGTEVPVFGAVVFPEAAYDLFSTPLWVDRAVDKLRGYLGLVAEIEVLQEGIARLEKELRVTTQRVNLFEKVKIPECQENIRIIRIYLGDQMANAVGIGKVAKKKLELAEV